MLRLRGAGLGASQAFEMALRQRWRRRTENSSFDRDGARIDDARDDCLCLWQDAERVLHRVNGR